MLASRMLCSGENKRVRLQLQNECIYFKIERNIHTLKKMSWSQNPTYKCFEWNCQYSHQRVVRHRFEKSKARRSIQSFATWKARWRAQGMNMYLPFHITLLRVWLRELGVEVFMYHLLILLTIPRYLFHLNSGGSECVVCT